MASTARAALINANPRWARRRFVKKHSGLGFSLMIATPISAMLWAAIIYGTHLA